MVPALPHAPDACLTCEALQGTSLESNLDHTAVWGPTKELDTFLARLVVPERFQTPKLMVSHPLSSEHELSAGRSPDAIIKLHAVYRRGCNSIAISPHVVRW